MMKNIRHLIIGAFICGSIYSCMKANQRSMISQNVENISLKGSNSDNEDTSIELNVSENNNSTSRQMQSRRSQEVIINNDTNNTGTNYYDRCKIHNYKRKKDGTLRTTLGLCCTCLSSTLFISNACTFGCSIIHYVFTPMSLLTSAIYFFKLNYVYDPNTNNQN